MPKLGVIGESILEGPRLLEAFPRLRARRRDIATIKRIITITRMVASAITMADMITNSNTVERGDKQVIARGELVRTGRKRAGKSFTGWVRVLKGQCIRNECNWRVCVQETLGP